MSFKSILKKSLTSGLLQQKLSVPELIVTLLVTVFFAVYILILYRKMTKSTFYSRTFGISLVMLSVVTAGMILSMQANFVITFGMLGSLSLIRFRTSVKGTVDQIFIFLLCTLFFLMTTTDFLIHIGSSLLHFLIHFFFSFSRASHPHNVIHN